MRALLLAAALLAVAVGHAAAVQHFAVTPGSLTVSNTAPLTSPPWYTGVTWVNIVFPDDANGGGTSNYIPSPPDSSTCAAGVSPSSQNWGSATPGLAQSDPFNVAPYLPFTAESTSQALSQNIQCEGWATMTTTQTLTMAPGQSIQDLIFGADIAPLANSGATLLELFVEDNGVVTPVIQYASSNVGAVPAGYTVYPDPPPGVMINAAISLTISGGPIKYGFRARSIDNTVVSDNWYVGRVFFGCIGPAHTATISQNVSYLDTSVTVDSQVSLAALPNGATTASSDIAWTLSCPTAVAFGTGLTKTFTVGPAGSGSDITVTTSTNNNCRATFKVTTSKGCYYDWTIFLRIAGAPTLSPVTIAGVPAAPVTTYPATLNLGAVTANPPIAPTTYNWTITCTNGATTTGTASNISLLAGPGGLVDPTVTGPVNCTAVVSVSTPLQGKITSAPTLIQFGAAPIVIPPGGITGLPPDGNILGPYPKNVTVGVNATGIVGNATYNWTIVCPPGSSPPDAQSAGPLSDFTFTAGDLQQVDPFNPYGNLPCVITVTVCTPAQGCTTTNTTTTVLPPPLITSPGGPYIAPVPYPSTVDFNGTGTQCASPACTYTWATTCPDGQKYTTTGKNPSITVGPTGNIKPAATDLNCTVTLTVTDANNQTTTANTSLIVKPSLSIPPGGITGLGPNGTIQGPYPKNVTVTVNVTGVVEPANYSWAITCPPGVPPPKATGSAKNFTFTAGDMQQVDPFNPYANLPCNITVTVCTPTQGCTSSSVDTTAEPTPIPATIGPYIAPTPYPSSLTLNSSGSQCGTAPCTSSWNVTCPDGQSFTATGATPNITFGPAPASLQPPPSGLMNCTVTLTVTDGASPPQTTSVDTTLTIGTPLVIPPGGILGLPFPPGSDYAGPYPAMFNLTVNVTGVTTPPTYNWTLSCPPGSTPPIATATTPNLPYWVGDGYPVDPFNPYGNKKCEVTTTVSSGGQTASASANITYLAPPFLGNSTIGPYTAGPVYPASVALNATAFQCANGPCTYTWTITCPDGRNATLSGPSPTVTVADSANATINPFKPTPITSVQNCSVVLNVTDSGSPKQTTTVVTSLTLQPPMPSVSVVGGPFNITAGQTANLTGNATCSNPPCTYAWTVTCPPFGGVNGTNFTAGQTVTVPGVNGSVTTGPNNGSTVYNINTYGLGQPLVCNVSFTATDAFNLSGTAFTNLTITPAPPVCGDVNSTQISPGQNIQVVRLASPSNIRASTNSQVCSAKKRIRKGQTQQKAQTLAFIPQFTDPQGFTVVPVIDGVLTNNGENLCRCKITRRNNCTCIGDARILPGGQGANLMAGVTPKRNGFKGKQGRTYLLRFTGTSVVTGQTCTGFASVCVIKQKKNLKGAPPPACARFPSTVTLRDATRCNNVTVNVADSDAGMASAFAQLGA